MGVSEIGKNLYQGEAANTVKHHKKPNIYTPYKGRNKGNLYCRLKLSLNANRAGRSWGFVGSKMPLDWLKIGLNSVQKITLLSLTIPLEG